MKKKYFTILFLGLIIIVLSLALSSCNNNDDGLMERVYWKLYLNPQSQVPAVDRPETAIVTMQLLSDNTLSYRIVVSDLVNTDQLTAAHLHAGDPLTNGPIVLNLDPTFSNGVATGSMIIHQSLVDSLVNLSNQIYVNVHSTEHPDGLVRGQVNSDILMAADVVLTGANQVPPITTTASGKALIRLTSDNKLYSNVSVTGLEGSDTLTMAHIHLGAAGVNGAILVTLCNTIADFGINKVNTLNAGDITTLKTASTYVNAHSVAHSTGVVRGQFVNDIVTPPVIPTVPY